MTKRKLKPSVSMAKQYLSQISVGEWKWAQNTLTAPDGTTILWVTIDHFGEKYIGMMADYEDFIARSALLVKALVDEVERISEIEETLLNAVNEYRFAHSKWEAGEQVIINDPYVRMLLAADACERDHD